MPEIAALPWNGHTVISTFSGCGGSSLGYRMAGFKVVWANEFVPIAQASYIANSAPETILDKRDIKTITVSDILAATGLAVGALDLLDGSPPCQAFSTAGKRERGWGEEKRYAHGATQKNEDLFVEYIRLVRGLQPKVFVAENVSGLIKGVAKGYFKEILAALKACGYVVEVKLLDAQWLGVPQVRQRVIFMGVRTDVQRPPAFPRPLPYRYSVRDALPWIGASEGERQTTHDENRQSSQEHLTLPPSRLKAGAYGVHEIQLEKPCPTVTCASPGNDLTLVIEERHRIGTEHANAQRRSSVIHDTGGSVQQFDITNRPCPTITIGDYGANSSHYLIAGDGGKETRVGRQPDGIVRRKFTIAELKRICGFPDDFILKGSYAQQWERLGNAVPPVMMFHIARTIRDEILKTL